jgi:hypothetical protein
MSCDIGNKEIDIINKSTFFQRGSRDMLKNMSRIVPQSSSIDDVKSQNDNQSSAVGHLGRGALLK